MNILANYRRLKRRRELDDINGFTLFELLIVIVVLGILAAVIISALGGITGESASSAIQAFLTQNPSATPTVTGLLQGTPADNNTAYIQSWPLNDPHYEFALTSDGALVVQFKSTDLWPNGETGTPSSSFAGGSPTTGELYRGAATCANLT